MDKLTCRHCGVKAEDCGDQVFHPVNGCYYSNWEFPHRHWEDACALPEAPAEAVPPQPLSGSILCYPGGPNQAAPNPLPEGSQPADHATWKDGGKSYSIETPAQPAPGAPVDTDLLTCVLGWMVGVDSFICQSQPEWAKLGKKYADQLSRAIRTLETPGAPSQGRECWVLRRPSGAYTDVVMEEPEERVGKYGEWVLMSPAVESPQGEGREVEGEALQAEWGRSALAWMRSQAKALGVPDWDTCGPFWLSRAIAANLTPPGAQGEGPRG